MSGGWRQGGHASLSNPWEPASPCTRSSMWWMWLPYLLVAVQAITEESCGATLVIRTSARTPPPLPPAPSITSTLYLQHGGGWNVLEWRIRRLAHGTKKWEFGCFYFLLQSCYCTPVVRCRSYMVSSPPCTCEFDDT